ncbi:MAG: aromatic ring-hydroxylating oxygenase subunit alpha [Gemmataceae bacterium]
MFIHEARLVHLLSPAAYFTEEQYQAECQHLFKPSWHLIASLAEIPHPGDFLTREVMGISLLVYRHPDRVGVYRNACPHRHGKLLAKNRGNIPFLSCPFHGGKFGPDGKALESKENQEGSAIHPPLQSFRVECCGELVFINLSAEGPSLAEQLGPEAEFIERSYSNPFRLVWSKCWDIEANWKIPLENGLESYHIPCLHARTFRNYPEEPRVLHRMDSTGTSYQTEEMDRWVKKGIRRASRWLGLPSTENYTHCHVFPHLTFVAMDTFRMAQIFYPTSATTSQSMVWIYAPYGPNRGVIPWLYSRINAWLVTEIARKVLLEDAPIFPDVQRGIEQSSFPGVIGRREERIWAFQDHVVRLCNQPSSS